MIPSRLQVKTRTLALLDDPQGKVFLQQSGIPGTALPVTTGSWAGSVATLTIGANTLVVGQAITVGGITPAGYNGIATVTAVAASTVSFILLTNPGAYGSGGYVQTSTSPFDEAFGEAYDALWNGGLVAQAPRIRNIVVYTLPPNTKSFTPAQAGISDFGDYIELQERLSGSGELFRPMGSVEQLPQRPPFDQLLVFDWRWDTFYFVGATTARDIQITYESSGTAPIVDSASIGWDGSLTFLSNYCAGVAGPRKGYDELAVRCMALAVGPKYNEGVIGGELFRILQSRVRSMQKTQIAPRKYSVTRRYGFCWPAPFVASQQPSSGGPGVPAQFTTLDGTLTPPAGNGNAQFFLAYPVVGVTVAVNGVFQTQGIGGDYTFGANQITFNPGSIPNTGDIITVEGYIGASATVVNVPGPPINQASALPPSGPVVPIGTVDGSNAIFTMPVAFSKVLLIISNLVAIQNIQFTVTNGIITIIDPNFIPTPGVTFAALYW